MRAEADEDGDAHVDRDEHVAAGAALEPHAVVQRGLGGGVERQPQLRDEVVEPRAAVDPQLGLLDAQPGARPVDVRRCADGQLRSPELDRALRRRRLGDPLADELTLERHVAGGLHPVAEEASMPNVIPFVSVKWKPPPIGVSMCDSPWTWMNSLLGVAAVCGSGTRVMPNGADGWAPGCGLMPAS